MKRFIEGEDRSQVTLLPECLDDYIGQDNPVRVVDAFVEELDLRDFGLRERRTELKDDSAKPTSSTSLATTCTDARQGSR